MIVTKILYVPYGILEKSKLPLESVRATLSKSTMRTVAPGSGLPSLKTFPLMLPVDAFRASGNSALSTIRIQNGKENLRTKMSEIF